jgi:HEAT repeat protein
MKKFVLALLCASTCFAAADSENCQQQLVLELDTKSVFTFKSNSTQRIKIKGLLSMKTFNEPHEQGIWWGLKGENITLSSGELSQVDADYNIAFAVLRDQQGLLRDFRFPQGLTGEQQEKLKGLAYTLQFRLPPYQKFRTSYAEQDGIGQVQVGYRLVDGLVEKEKLEYQLKADQKGAIDSINIKESLHVVRPDNCWLSHAKGKETLVFEQFNGSYNLTTVQAYEATKQEHVGASLLWDLTSDASLWPGIEKRILTEAEISALRKEFSETIGHMKLAEIDAFDLSDFLLKYDVALDLLFQLLENNQFNEADNIRLYHALGLADTDNAQKLLTNILASDFLSDDDKFRAMQGLVQGTGYLSDGAYNELIGLLNGSISNDETMNNALLLAAGAMVQSRKEDPNMTRLQDKLRSDLTSVKGRDRIEHIITSLSNTADVANVTYIKPYQNSESNIVRRNVARAYGQLKTEESLLSLKTMLVDNSETRVEAAVISSLGNYELDRKTTADIYQRATQSEDNNLRSASIKAMAKQISQYPEVKDDLRSMLSEEKSRKNFEAIINAIEGGGL